MPCIPFSDGKGGSGFACSRGRQYAASCDSPGCGRAHVALCDWPLQGAKAGKTCDFKLCERHRARQGKNRDFCPAHARAQAAAAR